MPSSLAGWFNWQDLVMKMVRAGLVAAMFEVFTFLAARRIETHLREIFAADAHRDPARRSRRRSKLRATVRSLCRCLFYPPAFLIMLGIFGMPETPLAFGYATAVAVTIVAARSWLQDLVNGLLILGEDQFTVGDVVALGDLEGTVERMSLRSTWLKTDDGQLHLIANRNVQNVRVAARAPTGS